MGIRTHIILINICFFTLLMMAFIPDAIGQKKKKSTSDSISSNNYDYFKTNYLRTENYVYKPNIKTVLFYREGFKLTDPIIILNSGEKVVLEFDDLDGDYKNMSYTLIHCDANWNPSDLLPNEYLNGFFEYNLSEHKFSFNTLQRYTHYSLVIPDDKVVPVLSGNYILKVFMQDEPDHIILTRRLMIADNKVSIQAWVKQPTIVEYRNYKQEVDFSIDKKGYVIQNVYNDLKVVVQQNGRTDNAVKNLKPLYIKGDILEYNYEEENVFSGGNIFREFDIKAMNFYTEFIAKIYKDESGYQVYLKPDIRKSFKVFQSRKDINGRVFIKSDDNARDTDIESEYVYVHFFLNYEAPLVNGAIYVFGGLTDWSLSNEGKLKYNYELKGYETTLYLKQGFYNYQYLFLENGTKIADETLIEGSHYETDNEYTIFVYHRVPGTGFDALIAFKQLNTFSR